MLYFEHERRVRFEFQNLGMIKKTTLDLRPLTIILGPNNTNKTYLAYCVHGLMRDLSLTPGIPPRFFSGLEDSSGRFDHWVDLSDITTAVQEKLERVAGDFVRELPEYFQDTYRGLFRHTKLSVRVEQKEVRNALKCLADEAPGHLVLKGEKVVAREVRDARNPLSKAMDSKLVRAGLSGSVVQSLAAKGLSLTLPAERNALVLTYKLLSTRRYRALRDQARAAHFSAGEARERRLSVLREQGDLRYPGPIEDFLDFLTDVELEAARPRNTPESAFGKLAFLIEQELQGGHRTSYEATPIGGQELALTVTKDLRIDLYNASSSIKQIAPLLLYLRYWAGPNQTLIIDEPEMNLHPEAQAKLLEALAVLANLRVRVLLTTHSPYFMAHLNNLIAADPASEARRRRQAKHLYMGEPSAFLSPDDVSAYQMGPEGLTSLSDPEYGVRWDTLSDVSAELQRRYFAILEEPKGRGKTT